MHFYKTNFNSKNPLIHIHCFFWNVSLTIYNVYGKTIYNFRGIRYEKWEKIFCVTRFVF